MVERLGRDRHGMRHVALLAVALGQLPLGLQPVEFGIQFGTGEPFLDRFALRLVLPAILLLYLCSVGELRARRFKADPRHRLAEQLAVFGLVDRFGVSADHFHAVAVQNTHTP